LAATIPARAIENHHDVLAGVALRDGIEEYLHAPAIDLGQNECVHQASSRFDGRVGIGLLMDRQGGSGLGAQQQRKRH